MTERPFIRACLIEWFISPTAFEYPVARSFYGAVHCQAPPEHWCRLAAPLTGNRKLPQRTATSILLSLQADVDSQAAGYAGAINPKEMRRHDLCHWIKDRMRQGEFNVLLHCPASCFASCSWQMRAACS